MKATSPYAYFAEQLTRKDLEQLQRATIQASLEERTELQNVMAFVLGCHIVPPSSESPSIQEQFPSSAVRDVITRMEAKEFDGRPEPIDVLALQALQEQRRFRTEQAS
jgi:hypothetical protein